MSDWSLVSALGAVGVLAALALGPVPELEFVLQLAGLGSMVGLVVAHRARRRSFRLETWTIMARWTLAGLVFGLFLLAVAALS